jgi:CheY-specific phosphatase CheX
VGAPKLSPSFFEEDVGQSFIQGAIKTIESYFGALPVAHRHTIAKDLVTPFELAGKINFEADGIKVQMLLAFRQDMIIRIYKQMLGVEHTTLHDELKDCAGELTNSVYGTAKAPLVDQGHKFALALPCSITEVNADLRGKKSLEIPFSTAPGAEKEFSLILSIA